MKPIALFLIAILLPAGAAAQALPENPQPAETFQPETRVAGQSMWDRLERLPRDQQIKIRFGNGRWELCHFAGASEEYLFCASGEDSGYVLESQINRLNITEFKIDHDARNGRLIDTAMAVTGGLWMGIWKWQTSSPQNAEAAGILAGLIGTGVGAFLGVPMSCLSGHCVAMPNQELPQPGYGFSVNVPLRRNPRRGRR